MKLLIAPWGNPFSWKEVRYRFGNTDCTSKTSLCALNQELKPDHILILVGDSLAKSENLIKEPNYSDIKNSVSKEIRSFLPEKYFSGADAEIEVCVLPGTGHFPNGSFEGEILDYYYLLLYHLAKFFSQKLPSEVHLDLTHGLNFMPVLTYRAVKEILQVVSFFRSTQFIAYNADPFTGEPEVLTLHVVEHTEEPSRFPPLSPYEVNESARFFEKLVVDTHNQKLKSVDKKWLKEILTFVGGIIYGLPLVLFTFFVPSEKVFLQLNEALEVYEQKMGIFLEGSRLHLKRRARFLPLFRVLTLTWLLLILFEKENLLKTRQEEVTLEDFETLSRKVFWKDVIYRSRIGTELKNLKNIKNSFNSWKFLSELSGRKPDSPDPRNFFAHAGLEKNALQVCRSESALMLRYAEEKIKNIQSFILEALKQK